VRRRCNCPHDRVGAAKRTAYRPAMFARRFLYIIAALIIVVLALGLVWSLMQDRLMRLAFVPNDRRERFTPAFRLF